MGPIFVSAAHRFLQTVQSPAIVTVAPLPQLYELLLHFTQHSNHNIVTSALDALGQLLRAPPAELLAALLSEGALERSRLQPEEGGGGVGKANSEWERGRWAYEPGRFVIGFGVL